MPPVTDISGDFIMLDENYTSIVSDELAGFINGVNISNHLSPICACNGLIYIIDDLIWAPVINLNENDQLLDIYPNPAKNTLNVSKITQSGVLSIINLNGRTVFSKVVDNKTIIDISKYQPGLYLVEFKSTHYSFTESLIIN